MRITITDSEIPEYRKVYLKVKDWFCEKEGIVHNTASVIKQTDLAILLQTGDKEVWCPKSLIEVQPIPKGLEAFQSHEIPL